MPIWCNEEKDKVGAALGRREACPPPSENMGLNVKELITKVMQKSKPHRPKAFLPRPFSSLPVNKMHRHTG